LEYCGALGVSLSYGSCSPATSEGRGHEEVGVSETLSGLGRVEEGLSVLRHPGAVLCGTEFGEESATLVLVG
jgi:hypothetical protein